MKALTVKELKEKLEMYDDDLIIVVLQDGKMHYHPITDNHFEVKEKYYLPYASKQENKKALQIGII